MLKVMLIWICSIFHPTISYSTQANVANLSGSSLMLQLLHEFYSMSMSILQIKYSLKKIHASFCQQLWMRKQVSFKESISLYGHFATSMKILEHQGPVTKGSLTVNVVKVFKVFSLLLNE